MSMGIPARSLSCLVVKPMNWAGVVWRSPPKLKGWEEMLAGDPVSIRAIWSPSGSMMCPLFWRKWSVNAMALFLSSYVSLNRGVNWSLFQVAFCWCFLSWKCVQPLTVCIMIQYFYNMEDYFFLFLSRLHTIGTVFRGLKHWFSKWRFLKPILSILLCCEKYILYCECIYVNTYWIKNINTFL